MLIPLAFAFLVLFSALGYAGYVTVFGESVGDQMMRRRMEFAARCRSHDGIVTEWSDGRVACEDRP